MKAFQQTALNAMGATAPATRTSSSRGQLLFVAQEVRTINDTCPLAPLRCLSGIFRLKRMQDRQRVLGSPFSCVESRFEFRLDASCFIHLPFTSSEYPNTHYIMSTNNIIDQLGETLWCPSTKESVKPAQVLTGKLVLLLFSASWCGPWYVPS